MNRVIASWAALETLVIVALFWVVEQYTGSALPTYVLLSITTMLCLYQGATRLARRQARRKYE